MPNYKEMYLKLFRATETAANILISAQNECEELYLNSAEPKFEIMSVSDEISKDENIL